MLHRFNYIMVLFGIVVSLLLVLLIISSFLTVPVGNTETIVSESLVEIVEMVEETEDEESTVEFETLVLDSVILDKYIESYEQNKEMIGYVYLPNGLEYPVMFTPFEQNKYIDKDFSLNNKKEGLPFLNRFSCFGETGVSLMYGHNMKNGQALTGIKLYYENENYFEDYPTIQVDTLYEEITYEVVAVALTSLYEDFNYYEYVGVLDEEEFGEWKSGFEKYVVKGTLENLTAQDNILEMSICYYHKDDGRLVLILREEN